MNFLYSLQLLANTVMNQIEGDNVAGNQTTNTSQDFLVGVIFATLAFMVAILIALIIIGFSKKFQRMQELYKQDEKKQAETKKDQQEQKK